MKLSTYVSKTGSNGNSAPSSASCGTFISSTMIVMITAITPSVKASSRPLCMPARCDALDQLHVLQRQAADRLTGRRLDRVQHRGPDDADGRLAHAAPEVVARHDHRLHFRHLGKLQHRVV